ncbi:MAG: acyltransferase [Edaphobacter sp.]|uniref:acyltransferase family protein n=1 Tax=Edaphobacter sp. TaxID=1934404 RepID=UPI0023912146|nr:acyltransferase [Edaphobacter sp.]MDE1178831.1 acyltransferase [Edaphobacter sp.]
MNRRIVELDGLRAIAIFLVFGVHYAGFSHMLWKLPTYGWVGVDIFFALSGYLITKILLGLRGKQQAYKTFYSRRMIRIAPPYLVATAAVLLLGLIAKHAIHPGEFLLHQLLFLQAISPKDLEFFRGLLTHLGYYLTHIPTLFPHLTVAEVGLDPKLSAATTIYWSLSVEEYFYLLWAPVVLHFNRNVAIGVGIAVCLVSAWLRMQYGEQAAYFCIFTRLDALLYGAFLAMLFDMFDIREMYGKLRMTRGLQIVALVSVCLLALIVIVLRPAPGADLRQSPLFLSIGLGLISIAATSLVGLLVMRANTEWWVCRLLRTRPFQFIGTISYAMYLFHMIVAFLVNRVFMAALKRPYEIPQALLSVVLTILSAWLSWHFIEKPMLRWKDRHFPAVQVSEPTLN